jgi:hypothetical protein
MAGENILPAEHYPDYFQILSHSIDHNLIPNTSNRMVWFYVEPRASNGSGIVVDSITYGIAVTDASRDLDMFHATTPQATSGTLLQTAAISTATVGTYAATIDKANNFVPAGSWISIKTNGNVNTLHGAVTIRFRSRLK